jgi:hypothetical protein
MLLLRRIIVLVTIALLGWMLCLLAFHLMIITNIINTKTTGDGFGYEMTSKAVMVWIASVVLGIISLFIQQKWRYILLLAPIYAPVCFAFIYALSSR